jgi:hypothetical protein
MPIADVVFEDPQLQNCLLTNSSGFTFTREVINLGCQSMGITSLGGIERFTNLVVLNLSNFNTSLTPIPGTPNQVQDLTPLASTFTLQALILDGNDVRDLFALRELRDLRALLVRFNPNLAAVRGLLFMDDLFRVELEGSGVTQQISCADLTTLSARLTEFSSPVNCDGVVRPSTTIGNTDLNDDGSADLVLEYNADSGVALGASSASKFWGFGVATPPSGRFDTSGLALQGFDTSVFARARAIAVADANADGRDDLLVQLDAIDGSVRWWVQLSDGVGGLGVRMDAFSLPGGNDARAVAFKDIDGDDRADILIQQQINGLVSYHVSMGTGVSFTAPEPLYTFDPGLGRPDIVALEDVNNDGTADLVFDRRLGDQHCYFVRLYNNFNGAFQQQSTSRDCHVLVSTPLGSVTGVGVADLDGDRRSELVIQQDVNELHTKWLYLTTFESSRSGTEWGSLRILAEEFTAPGTKRSFRTISVADLNGDGRSDLLVEVTTGTIKAFWAYIASAYGGFEKSVWLDGQNVSNRTLGLRDFNNDGLPDLLIDATPNLSTSQQIYVKLNERGISFGSNILGATDLWYEDSGFPRIAGLEEDGLTSVAHELGSLLAWAGTSDAKLHTPNELSQMLSAKGPGLTLRKPKYEDIGDLPLNDNECQVLYTKGSTERRTRGQFGVMACNVILAKGASLKLQPIYGGCETVNVDSVDSGFGGNCEIGSLKNELKLKVGPVVQTTTVKGPTAGSCGAISKEFICAGSSVALVRGSQTYEFGKDNGIGAGACLGCFGAGASLKEENGVISGSFELDFIAGVEFEYSVNTATVAEGAEFLVKTGNKGFVYVGENVEQGVLAAGDTFISAAQNAAGTAVDISRITQTAAGDAVFIAREGAEAVGLVLRSDSIAGQTIDAVITGVNESIDAVGGAAAYAVELAKTGGEAIWDGLNSVISSIGDLF